MTLFEFAISYAFMCFCIRNSEAKIRPMGHLVYGYKGEGASNVLSSVSVFGLAVVVVVYDLFL